MAGGLPTDGDGQPERQPRALRILVAVCATVLTLCAFAFALGLPRRLGLALYDEQFLAAMLGLALALVFLVRPARPLADGAVHVPRWYDVLAAVAGLGAGMYVAVRYESLLLEVAFDPAVALVPGAILLLLVLEGVRRTAGPALMILLLLFVLYGTFGYVLPGPLSARGVSIERLVAQVTLDPNGILGTPLFIAVTIVIAFVFFGLMLTRAGGGEFFTNLALALMGRFRGGSAKIAIFASGLFGSISGSPVSNVVSTGVITIPLMEKGGYSRRSAGAIEAVASTGGQLMPPIMGAAAFLMAEFLQIPYREVVLAALLPAVLYYAALFMQADLRAAQLGIRSVPAAEIPSLPRTFRSGWFFVIPFAVLIFALFRLHLRPEEAALWSVACLIVLAVALGYRGRRLNVRDLLATLRNTGTTVLDIIMITAAAGVIIGILNLSGLSFALTRYMLALGEGSIVLLLALAAGISIILGMGMPTVGVYVLLALLVAPSLVELGITPIAAHLFVLYFGMMSMITPPVAIAAFAAATVSRAGGMETAFEAVRFGWPAYVLPFLFVAAPSLLFIGSPLGIFLAVSTALAGVWFISVAIVGHLSTRLAVPTRLVFVLAGAALLIPADAFAGAVFLEAAGAAVGLTAMWRQHRLSRLQRAA